MTRLLPEACAHTGGDPLGTPLMVTSIIRVHSVVLRAGTGAPGPGPELGKIASMLPNSAEARIRVRATKARLPPASIRSISCLIAWPPASAIRPGDLFQPVFAACIRNHLRACGGEELCGGLADTRSGAGDQNGFVLGGVGFFLPSLEDGLEARRRPAL